MYQTIDPKELIVFITGATAGFGKALARRFAGAGAKVIVTGRRADRLQSLCEELGDRAHALTFDVRNRQEVEAAVAGLPEAFKKVNVLVNNAGLALGVSSADQAEISNWETMIDTNCKGLIYCTHALLPGMAARRDGHVINLSSVAGSYPYPGGNVYGATKAFVTQFSLNLRSDLNNKAVRVTSIEPGMAETEFSEVRFLGDTAKAAEAYKGMKPMSAEDIAESFFFAAPLPRHVNINRLEVMPVQQAFAGFLVDRDS